MKNDQYAKFSISDLRLHHRRLIRVAVEGRVDCDDTLETAEEVELAILKRPANGLADVVVKLTLIREALIGGGRTDGVDVLALDQVMRWLQSAVIVPAAQRPTDMREQSMSLHA
jgi:hypothetical protein